MSGTTLTPQTAPGKITMIGTGSPITTVNYGVIFVGSEGTGNDQFPKGDAANILASLDYLLKNATFSGISQYINNGTVSSITASPIALNGTTAGTYFTSTDTKFVRDNSNPKKSKHLSDIAGQLCASPTSYFSGTNTVLQSGGSAATTQLLVLVLPPGATLKDWYLHKGHKDTGVHGKFSYDNYVVENSATLNGTVYFCAVTWGGDTDVPASWSTAPWMGTCATIYKEIAQFWTNPDVDDIPDINLTGSIVFTQAYNGNASVVTQSSGNYSFAEVGNLAFLNGGTIASTTTVYGTISTDTTLNSGSTLTPPMHTIWSNSLNCPYVPPEFTQVTK